MTIYLAESRNVGSKSNSSADDFDRSGRASPVMTKSLIGLSDCLFQKQIL